MSKTPAYAAPSPGAPLAPFTVERRDPGPHDVLVDILYCGVCHSDIHQARDEWGGGIFPMVPGHEIVGRVREVGKAVTKLAPGDVAGVGCMVDSCRECDPCRHDSEQFCEKGAAFTYNGTEMDRRTRTYGGYSTRVVVDERFVLKVPASLDPAGAAPLLCAGITTYSPLRQWNCKPGDRVAVVGLGGLGHMAVKLAASMGAEVTMLSTSASKEADARRLGAHGFASTRDASTFSRLAGRFDLIVDTISAPHDYNAYLRLLRPKGAMVLLGVPPEPTPVAAFSLISGNKRLAGSLIGGIAETQEMLDYCAAHGIVSDVEIIPIQKINEAYDRMMRGDVRYRFVIDVSSLERA
ncbi:NAD(P)-dependent alcohol dehydrogenase [Anaeromyxobacter sp. SG17]|uniref:NAD(P)-dependent alcohol dehydrogenase n=1 Tax=Anaeromyxobacter sp. SG17 TaxID=2925405 RepID=UPI001F59B7BC|nr:NAD(P)-dependent alcohol dehydrogenase [Anaeromyxobacter sp. SG17]